MENPNNIGMIHESCANQRIKIFQDANPEPNIKVGNHVKIKFTYDVRNEWMWVKVTSFNEETKEIEGILDSDPVIVESMTYGDVVKTNYSEVCEVYRE